MGGLDTVLLLLLCFGLLILGIGILFLILERTGKRRGISYAPEHPTEPPKVPPVPPPPGSIRSRAKTFYDEGV